MALDVGMASSFFAGSVVLSACAYSGMKKKWPDVSSAILLFLAALGVASGIKIIWYGLLIESTKLGPLADDRPVLLLGGIAALLFAAKEMVSSWQKTVT